MHEVRVAEWRSVQRLVVAAAGGAGIRLVDPRAPRPAPLLSSAETAAVEAAAAMLAETLHEASLVLLWPHGAGIPARLRTLVRERIDYPVPESTPAPLDRTVAALRSARCDGAVVLAAGGATPFLPAYLCYLAGIERRAAMTAEFGGGVLSDVVPPPAAKLEDLERHYILLRALGLVSRANGYGPDAVEPAHVATVGR